MKASDVGAGGLSFVQLADLESDSMCGLYGEVMGSRGEWNPTWPLLSPSQFVLEGRESALAKEFNSVLAFVSADTRATYTDEGALALALAAGVVEWTATGRILLGFEHGKGSFSFKTRLMLATHAFRAEHPKGEALLRALAPEIESHKDLIGEVFSELIASCGERAVRVIVSFVPVSAMTTSLRDALKRAMLASAQSVVEADGDASPALEAALLLGGNEKIDAEISALLARMKEIELFVCQIRDGTVRKAFAKNFKGKAAREGSLQYLKLLLDVCDFRVQAKVDWVTRSGLRAVVEAFFSLWTEALPYKHLKPIFAEAKIGKSNFRCPCPNCFAMFASQRLPVLRKQIDYFFPQIPRMPIATVAQQATDECQDFSTLPDPFLTLGVTPDAPKAEVMQRVMALIRTEPHRMAQFRRAQADIFDPTRRRANMFLRRLVFATQKTELSAPLDKRIPLPSIPLIAKWARVAKR